jgi:hypothetical protein
MSNGEPKETKEELEEELQGEDQQAGDDQTDNPDRDKFTSLYGE